MATAPSFLEVPVSGLLSHVHLEVGLYSVVWVLTCTCLLQVDKLDALESLHKHEEHVGETAPLVFGR